MKSLLFLPDISGFTKFVQDTEIEHSRHIIGDLLEVILNANIENLVVSEIEGDAIFFYRPGDPPSLNDLLDQIKKMFLEFHTRIREIERDRVCECGACSTAINLGLKFIVHYGEVRLSKVKDHTKLIGSDVIIAHRLMKNPITDREYVLFSLGYLSAFAGPRDQSRPTWVELKSGMSTYEHIGEVQYHYILLNRLRSAVPEIPAVSKVHRAKKPIRVELELNSPMSLIYNTIIDLALRMEWTTGLKKIDFKRGEIPHIGAKHICVFPIGDVELETASRVIQKDMIEYAERATNIKLVKNPVTFYVLRRKQNTTMVSFEFHYKSHPVIGLFIDLFFRPAMARSLTESLVNLKKLCERKMFDSVKVKRQQ